ncbi:huntingtin interacting protein 1 isoform X3 [Oratosquilla oratoria]|uniref:huntingtin interacting protein 1 isoform X3 n=1 Tax=Oratosquilla oratoria TaxID=337810 RepID=UPI003F7732AB
MTSIKQKIPGVLGARRGTTLDQERENFERSQEASIRKAINDEEVPVKMKHVRNIIIGTFHDKNAEIFWRHFSFNTPLQSDLTAWKFCHALHLVLRDGHPNVLRDCQKHRIRLKEIGEHFKHLTHGYGPLIKAYTDLLICKLNFHQRYPRFPGNLNVSPEELEQIGENDANNYFEMAVEMLEYMEGVLNVYEAVFGSLDPSRSNSMTKMGQCRLAPLIPCIQDSSCLYDCEVRILFQLHKVPKMCNPNLASLPTDMLSGHRSRFYKQFTQLQQFYNNTRNLQYFKGLIQVPALPQDPPNFLIEAELKSHVAPVVVVEEPDPNDSTDLLVDTSELPEPQPPPIPPHPDVVDAHNGMMADVLAERESLIEALQQEIEVLRMELQRTRSETAHREEQLHLKINTLESSLAELESQLIAEKHSKECVLAQVEAASQNAEAVVQLADAEAKKKAAEEKFLKMKEVYQKLRDEHIQLIRGKAEVDKQLQVVKEVTETERKSKAELESQMLCLEEKLSHQDRVENEATEAQSKVSELISTKQELEQERQCLQEKLAQVSQERDTIAAEQEEVQLCLKTLEERLLSKDSEFEAKNEEDLYECVSKAVEGAMMVIVHALSHFDQPQHADVKCSAEYTLLYESTVNEKLSVLSVSYIAFMTDHHEAPRLVHDIAVSAHHIAVFLVHAKAVSHACTSIEHAEVLVSALEEFAQETIQVLETISSKQDVLPSISSSKEKFQRCCSLVLGCEAIGAGEEDVAIVVQREMEAMDKAIQDAVERFVAMLEATRAHDSGMQLEVMLKGKVNEGILGTCGELMAAVRLLVQRASQVQEEIVAAGKGGASPKEFYKRNHRWTEGLISGAKAVAIACQALMTAADQVVSGEGKFEEVMVASKEIAASSMQLVMASKVKADKSSTSLGQLNAAAKTISSLTGTVVATAENCRDKVSEANTLDFSKLSLHSAKRMEMDCQVRVLELEKLLEDERVKLAELRRHHYKLAGELEGWDEEDIPK